MSKSGKGSPRKFAEKIALLNKKEAESTAEFEKIIQEVEQTTRATPSTTAGQIDFYDDRSQFCWTNEQGETFPVALPTRSSSFSDRQTHAQSQNHYNQLNHNHSAYINVIQSQQPGTHQRSVFTNQPINNSTAFVRRVPQQRQPHQEPHLQRHQPQPCQDSQGSHDYQMNGVDNIGRTIPFNVPNIEIFPTHDDFSHHQQQVQNSIIISHTAEPQNPNSYIGHNCRTDCSNLSSISSSRSLPNIANLRVSGHSPSQPSGQFAREAAVIINQRLAPANDNYNNMIAAGSNESIVDSNGNYFDDQHHSDYCSIPSATQIEPVQQSNSRETSNMLSRTSPARRSYTDISESNQSWQGQALVNDDIHNSNGNINTSDNRMNHSAPSSAATTPPGPSLMLQNDVYRTSPQQQLSPADNSLQQTQMLQLSPERIIINTNEQTEQYISPPFAVTRANSMGTIDNIQNQDLLNPIQMNGNMSKSYESRYSYLDDQLNSLVFQPQPDTAI